MRRVRGARGAGGPASARTGVDVRHRGAVTFRADAERGQQAVGIGHRPAEEQHLTPGRAVDGVDDARRVDRARRKLVLRPRRQIGDRRFRFLIG